MPWTPNRDTLAVIDYAASKSIAGQPAFAWLKSLFLHSNDVKPTGRTLPLKVRIVLLDRTDQGALWSDWRNSDEASDLDRITLSIPLGPDREEFAQIVSDEFFRRKQCAPSMVEHKAVGSLTNRLRDQFRPLFGLLTAAAISDPLTGLTHSWSPELLVEGVLNAQIRQWKAGGITDEHLDLLYEATLTQGACNSAAGFTNRFESLNPATLTTLASLSETEFPLGPIVPDLLGEFFILMRLRGDATSGTRLKPLNIRTANEIFKGSWQHETAAAFAGLLLEDYLDWAPKIGSNPALDVMRQALGQVESGADCSGTRIHRGL